MTDGDVLPEELVETLLRQAVLLTLQSHGYTAVHPHAVSLIIEVVEKRLLSLLRRAASMANTQRRLLPSPTDLNYAFLMENIHTHTLEDEIARWPAPPPLQPETEPVNEALQPSPVNKEIFNELILPSSLRPSTNTPSYIPPTFPRFPPKYTYAFTSSYPPRATDPEEIRKRAVQERDQVEKCLAKLVVETPVVQVVNGPGVGRRGGSGGEGGEGREERDAVWWRTWREMGFDAERGVDEIWPVPKVRRGVAGAG